MRHLVGRASTIIIRFPALMCLMISPLLAVAGSPEVRTDKDVYTPKERIVVTFKNASGNKRDVIGISRRGDAPGSSAPYKYTRRAKEGSYTFSKKPVGAYEARLTINGRKEIAASYPFVVSAISLFIPPAVEPDETGRLGKAPDLASQCRVVQAWVERLNEEIPDFKNLRRGQPQYIVLVGNLFRDDEYAPVFGRTYARTADSASAQIEYLIKLCVRTIKDKKQKNILNYLTTAFKPGSTNRRKKVFTERVEVVQGILKWIEDVTEEIKTLPPTDGGFTRMLEIYDASSSKVMLDLKRRGKVALIWPGEVRALTTSLKARKSTLVVAYARGKISAYPADLASIKKIDGSLALARTHVLDADKAAFATLGALADKRRLEIFSAAIATLPPEVQNLEKLDAVLAKAESYYRGLNNEEQFAKIEAVARKLRREIYRNGIEKELAALPEFPDRLESLSKIEARKQYITDLVGTDGKSTGYAEYQTAAATRQQAIFEESFERFKDQLDALPVSFAGAKEPSTILRRLLGNVGNLSPDYRNPFEVAASARAAAIYDQLVSDLKKNIQNESGGWRDAQASLGWMYANGRGVARDDREAVKWYRQAAEQGHAGAQYNLGVMYDSGRGVAKDDREAVKWYRQAAEQGDARAQNNLGGMYNSGRGVAKDAREAVKWYRQAAEQGHVWAQYNLGVMYANGRGVAKDDREAVKWYRQAAEQGDAAAQTNLGWMYASGRGVAKDEAEAVKWYRQAAEQGNAAAQYNLGMMYVYGRGVAKNDREAVKWYSQAAEQGDAAAQYSLGWMYENGRGMAKDDTKAAKWYRKAAMQGDADAQANLGALFMRGKGVRKNYGEAAKWSRKAAEQGNVAGQVTLGILYLDGNGVPKNRKKGRKLLAQAARQGNNTAIEISKKLDSGKYDKQLTGGDILLGLFLLGIATSGNSNEAHSDYDKSQLLSEEEDRRNQAWLQQLNEDAMSGLQMDP